MKKAKLFLFIVILCVMALDTAAQGAGSRILGHRGGRYEFEENTLEAFELAASENYPDLPRPVYEYWKIFN